MFRIYGRCVRASYFYYVNSNKSTDCQYRFWDAVIVRATIRVHGGVERRTCRSEVRRKGFVSFLLDNDLLQIARMSTCVRRRYKNGKKKSPLHLSSAQQRFFLQLYTQYIYRAGTKTLLYRYAFCV